MRRVGTLIIALAAAFAVTAQDFAFKVMVNQSGNEYKLTGGDWQAVKTGLSLPSSSELKLSGYIGLYHKSGQTIQLTDAGSYKVSELEKGLKGKNSSVISKYADFVQTKMSEQSKEDTRNRLAATGAVERGLGDIDIYLPGSANFYEKKSWIAWENKAVTKLMYFR